MVLYILQCLINVLFIVMILVFIWNIIINKPKIKKVTIIDDISDRTLSSMAKQLISTRKQRDELERKYDDKQIECAILTCEINDMVEKGAKTSLTKDQKTGGYITHTSEG